MQNIHEIEYDRESIIDMRDKINFLSEYGMRINMTTEQRERQHYVCTERQFFLREYGMRINMTTEQRERQHYV